jgi:hypothetical protein
MQRERPIPVRQGWKDRICFYFPYIVCDKKIHVLVKEMFINGCDIDFGKENSMEKIYSCVLENWFVYFSTKPNKEPYEITKIYNNETLDAKYRKNDYLRYRKDDHIYYQKNDSFYEIIDMLSVRNKCHMLIQPICDN